MPRRLAILSVYCGEGMGELISIQHAFLKECCGQFDYHIFAGTPRLSREQSNMLACMPRTEIVPIENTPLRDNWEHAYYLDCLLEHVAPKEFDIALLIDSDAFPISASRMDDLVARLTDAVPFAAPLRMENGDSILPHPCFLLVRLDWWRKTHPTVLLTANPLTNTRIREFATEHRQPIDTGIGFAWMAKECGVDWIRLLRSNRNELHPLLASIYGDLAFHLGGATRPIVISRGDVRSNARLAKYYACRKAFRPFFDSNLGKFALDLFFGFPRISCAIRNRKSLRKIRQLLVNDPQSLVDHLTDAK